MYTRLLRFQAQLNNKIENSILLYSKMELLNMNILYDYL